jgi:pyridoxamine 5'-phosphate oxidase
MLKLDSVGDNPFELFQEWYKDAQESELNDPNAMCVATVDNQGYPDARIVLLKEWDERGFVFYTNYNSRKGQQLLSQMKATSCFHWKSLRRQIRITGDVEQVSDEQANAYYNSRPKTSRLGAWASLQSSPLDQRETLEKRVADLEEQYKDEEHVPRPEHWSGFRIKPIRMEFWTEWEFRLHDRFEYIKDGNGNWNSQRLYP